MTVCQRSAIPQLLFKVPNSEKQHRKLIKLQLKAEECLTREEAQKIIKKADKAHRKLEEG